MKVLFVWEKGSTRRFLVHDKNKKFYVYYYYIENPLQSFVVDEKENLILDSYLLSDIILACENYVFYNHKDWN